MTRRVALCALILGAVGGSLAAVEALAQAAQRSPDEQATLQADQSFQQAVSRGDKTVLGNLLDSEFTWTDADGKTLTRAEVLQATPAPLIAFTETGEASSNRRFHNYGPVEVIHTSRERDNVLRIWVKRPAGWRQLLYQEVRLLDTEPAVAAGTGASCENPCKTVPYQPKNENERQAITAYMALQTATVARDSATWGIYVADEFLAANSNSNKVLDRRTRMEDLERNRMAGYSPMPVVNMKVLDFGEAMVLVTDHQPVQGRPVHITRMWIKRAGKWLESASYQTRIQAAPAKP